MTQMAQINTDKIKISENPCYLCHPCSPTSFAPFAVILCALALKTLVGNGKNICSSLETGKHLLLVGNEEQRGFLISVPFRVIGMEQFMG